MALTDILQIDEFLRDLVFNGITAISNIGTYFFRCLGYYVLLAVDSVYSTVQDLYNLLIEFLNLYLDIMDIAVGWIGIPAFEWAFSILISFWLVFVFVWVLNLVKSIVRFFF